MIECSVLRDPVPKFQGKRSDFGRRRRTSRLPGRPWLEVEEGVGKNVSCVGQLGLGVLGLGPCGWDGGKEKEKQRKEGGRGKRPAGPLCLAVAQQRLGKLFQNAFMHYLFSKTSKLDHTKTNSKSIVVRKIISITRRPTAPTPA